MMTTQIPRSHPRYLSLMNREKIANGYRKGLVHETGLIAHGRGEAFDYLIGEQTHFFAEDALRVAAAALLSARQPVLSVNGNVAALAAKECVELSDAIPVSLEVNLFHRSTKRMRLIGDVLRQHGANHVGGFEGDGVLPGLEHNRAICDKKGVFSSDVVLVPLEDGDRCKALQEMGKTVITIDLNPLSRTAQTARITIVDNLLRALPCLLKCVREVKKIKSSEQKKMLSSWDNKANLQKSVDFVSKRLNSLF